MPGAGLRRTAVLKGFTPVRIDTPRRAHEHSERRFTRLQEFAFSSHDAPQLVSSGPRYSGWSIALVKSTGHRIALGDDDKVSLLFPYKGTIHVRRRGEENGARPDELLIVAPGQRTTWISSGYLGALIQIPISAFDAMQDDTGVRMHRTVEHRPAGHSASLAAFEAIRIIEQDQNALHSDVAWHHLVRPIIASMACAEAIVPGSERPRALDHVLAAEAFMRANLHLKLSTDDIARTCGIKARALQAAFAHFRRQSPMEALNDLRVQEAAKHLQAAGRTRSVTEIALDCGFAHLGRFSTSYRNYFGERPSTTGRHHRGS